MADFARLLDALSNLIGTVIWPALVLFLLLKFRTQLGAAVDDLRATIRGREFTMKAGPSGVELTAGALTATALLEEAEASRTDGHVPATISPAVRDAVSALEAQSTSRPRLLWVDDRPENNRLEQRAFRELGMEIDLATSTAQALLQLEEDRFDVVVSDMGRPPDMRAGYTLLDAMRGRGDRTPFVIYAGSRAPEHVEEALRSGAVGTTNSPAELVHLVTRALDRSGAGDR